MTYAPKYSDNTDFFGEEIPDIAYSRVWFYITRCHRKYLPIMTKALRAEGINDPIWHEILFELKRAGEKGVAMSDLQTKLLVPQYALSRHVSRMEEKQLLERTCAAEDKRKQLLFESAKGAEIHDRVWQIYFDAILAELKPLMSSDEAYDLARDLVRLTA